MRLGLGLSLSLGGGVATLLQYLFNGLDTSEMTFARASVQTVADKDGVLRTVDAGVPAIEGAEFISSSEGFQIPSTFSTEQVGTKNGTVTRILEDPDWGGYLSEGARTNVCLDSRTFNGSNWEGTVPIFAKDQIGVFGDVNSAYTLTDSDGASFKYISQNISVSSDTNWNVASFYVKKDTDTTRFPEVGVQYVGGAAKEAKYHLNTQTGELTSRSVTAAESTASVVAVGSFWRVIVAARNVASGDTVFRVVFAPAGGTTAGVFSAAATGSAILDQVDINLNASFISSSIVTEATTVTRAATDLTETTANKVRAQGWGGRFLFNPVGAGQTAWLIGWYTDASNFGGIYIEPTQMTFRKVVAGTTTDATISYTHVAGTPVMVDVYQSTAGMGIRYSTWTGAAWAAFSAWTEDTTADGKADMVVASTMQHGALNNADYLSANIPELFVPIFSADPKSALEAIAAGDVQ